MRSLNRERFRSLVLRYIEVPGAKFFKALGMSPSAVTIFGFALSVLAAMLVGMGYLFTGGLVFILAGIMDLIDGALARYTGKVSKLGALLDSVFDRLGEAVLYIGLAIYAIGLYSSDLVLGLFIITLLVALVVSLVVSYLRAKGESLGIDTRTGLMTRPERVVIISLGLVLSQVWLALTVIAVLSLYTMCQRMIHIWRNTMDE